MRKFLIILALPLYALNPQYGVDLLRQGKFQEARHFFQRSITMEPGNPVNYLYLGYAFLGLKMPDSAEVYASKGLQLAPESNELQLLKISSLIQQKKFERAVSVAESFFEKSKGDSLARIALGQVYFNYAGDLYSRGEKLKAVEFYKKVLNLVPDFPGTYTNIAIIYMELGLDDSAQKYVNLGLNRFPGNPDILKAKAQLLAKQNKLKELKNTLGVLVTVDPSDIQIWLKLALVYRATGQMDSAIAIYEKLIKEFPDRKEVYFAYAEIYEGIFDFKKAREIYSGYLKRHPGDHEVLRKIAETYEGEGDYAHAIEYYKKIPGSDEKIAELLVKAGRKDEALATYKRLISKNPYMKTFWIDAASLIEDEDSLFAFLDRMQKVFPASPIPCGIRGKIYFKKGLKKRAEECLRKSAGSGSEDPEVYYDLASIYFERGDTKKGALTVKIAFRKLTTSISNIQKILSGNQNLLELKKHEKEIEKIYKTNEFLEKMLSLLEENTAPEEYLRFLKDLYSRYPTSFLVLRSLARYYEEKGDLDSALLYATRLVEVNPGIGRNHYIRAKILEKMGRLEEAFSEYKRAAAGGVDTITFAKDFIELAERTGKRKEAVEDLRQIDSPEVQKFLENLGQRR